MFSIPDGTALFKLAKPSIVACALPWFFFLKPWGVLFLQQTEFFVPK